MTDQVSEWIVKRRHFGGTSIVSDILSEEEALVKASELNRDYQTTIYKAEPYDPENHK